jgi:hypothetical protein
VVSLGFGKTCVRMSEWVGVPLAQSRSTATIIRETVSWLYFRSRNVKLLISNLRRVRGTPSALRREAWLVVGLPCLMVERVWLVKLIEFGMLQSCFCVAASRSHYREWGESWEDAKWKLCVSRRRKGTSLASAAGWGFACDGNLLIALHVTRGWVAGMRGEECGVLLIWVVYVDGELW